MSVEAKKLSLIEEILKIENDALLEEVEALLIKNKLPSGSCKSFKDFAEIWTTEEAGEMKRIIEENCEQINPDDWK